MEELLIYIKENPITIKRNLVDYISELVHTDLPTTVTNIANNNIIVTDQKLLFSKYAFESFMMSLGLSRDKIEASHLLGWLDFVFLPHSDMCFKFYDKEEDKRYYIYLTKEYRKEVTANG